MKARRISACASNRSVHRSVLESLNPVLGRRFRVITFDHRGTGHSEAGPDAGYATESLAPDAVSVLDATGVIRAHVYGHSMGGRVAQWEAINHAPVSALSSWAPRPGEMLAGCLTASRHHDAWDELARVTAPTLAIHGADDEMTPPENAKRVAAAMPGAELMLLDGARHGYYLEDPAATSHVIHFLQRHRISDGA